MRAWEASEHNKLIASKSKHNPIICFSVAVYYYWQYFSRSMCVVADFRWTVRTMYAEWVYVSLFAICLTFECAICLAKCLSWCIRVALIVAPLAMRASIYLLNSRRRRTNNLAFIACVHLTTWIFFRLTLTLCECIFCSCVCLRSSWKVCVHFSRIMIFSAIDSPHVIIYFCPFYLVLHSLSICDSCSLFCKYTNFGFIAWLLRWMRRYML